jgi:2-keto-3-deoxy-L-rhamnonate aldolase RhmA
LSLNNYSQQEVKQALRIVLKSVERHSKHAGVTGYLDFIRRYVRNY